MTQRLRNCSNSTNFETINCESYLSQLTNRNDGLTAIAAKGKNEVSKSQPSAGLATGGGTAKVKKQSQIKPAVMIKDSKHPLVEVKVKTHHRQPWKKMLTKRASSFDGFDPLRTVHFLAKELQTKLKTNTTGDRQVDEMLTAMQNAVERIPSDVFESRTPTAHLLRSQSELNIPVSRVDKSCQTSQSFAFLDPSSTSEIFQKKLESSTAKLETSCKQMEKLCEELKNEKRQLEHLLQTEMDKVTQLKYQLEIAENEKNKFTNEVFEKVVNDRQDLETKIKHLKQKVAETSASYHGPTVQDLKLRLQESQLRKTELEQENITLRHRLTTSDMEREKYVTLLGMRDRHITEILNEMNTLQEVVSEQLTQPMPLIFSSAPSSQSTLMPILFDPKKTSSLLHPICLNSKDYFESGDSSVVMNAEQRSIDEKANDCGEGNEIHDLFNELKRRAMTVSLPSFSALNSPSENSIP